MATKPKGISLAKIKAKGLLLVNKASVAVNQLHQFIETIPGGGPTGPTGAARSTMGPGGPHQSPRRT